MLVYLVSFGGLSGGVIFLKPTIKTKTKRSVAARCDVKCTSGDAER